MNEIIEVKSGDVTKDVRRGRISASGVERVQLCPGSFNAEKDKPRQTNALADAGTRIHAALESGDLDELDDEGERKIAERAAELRDELLQRFAGEPMLDGMELEHQKETRLRGLDGRVSGQFDGMAIDGHRAILYDYKTGYLEAIDASRNLQLRCLAVLVAEEWPQVTEITATIIQPRLRPEVSVVQYSSADLQIARVELNAILERAYSPGAPRQPGPIQCKYCKAKADCPEAVALAESLARVDGAVIPVERLPELLDTCAAAEKIIKAIRQKAKDLIEADPSAVPGFFLKQGAMLSTIVNPQKLFNRCNERHSILPHEFVQVCDVGKGKLKALLKEASGLKGKALETEMAVMLEGVVKETRKAASIAKEKPSR